MVGMCVGIFVTVAKSRREAEDKEGAVQVPLRVSAQRCRAQEDAFQAGSQNAGSWQAGGSASLKNMQGGKQREGEGNAGEEQEGKARAVVAKRGRRRRKNVQDGGKNEGMNI